MPGVDLHAVAARVHSAYRGIEKVLFERMHFLGAEASDFTFGAKLREDHNAVFVAVGCDFP